MHKKLLILLMIGCAIILALLAGTQSEQQEAELTIDTTNTNLILYVDPNDPSNLSIYSKHDENLDLGDISSTNNKLTPNIESIEPGDTLAIISYTFFDGGRATLTIQKVDDKIYKLIFHRIDGKRVEILFPELFDLLLELLDEGR
jgi:fructose-1,6-bisphosphatase